MGFFSSDEAAVVKTSDTTGNIHNNIVISKEAENTIEILLLIIAIFKFLEFLMMIYSGFIRKIKKRYGAVNQNV